LQQQLYRLLPSKPGAYIFKDENNVIIYVGKAKDLKKRVSSYFTKSRALDLKTIQLVSKIKKIDHIVVNSEIEAFLLEASLIKKHQPFYNIKFLDDKSYPYVKISTNGIPYVSISRNKKVDSDAKYFGPYPEVTPLKAVLKLLRKIFPYQTAANHSKRKCLYYHLGLCPCIPAVPENLLEYKRNIRNISIFFDGNKEKLLKNLLYDQKICIKNEEFEKAAIIQKQIEAIHRITNEEFNPFLYIEKPDSYYKRLQEEVASLKMILSEKKLLVGDLHRIECYDISNFSGTNATASMVVFINGDSSKKDYKRFKIRTKHTPDDFHMLKEVMIRRLKHMEWGIPNLMVIDGGKGQVSSVLNILMTSEYKIPIIGLAKKEEVIIVPKITQSYSLEFDEIKFPKSEPGINLLRTIRNEAHRFAVTYHKLLRSKATFKK